MQVAHEVRSSAIAGRGIFLLAPVRRGTLLWRYKPGESVVEHDEASLRSRLRVQLTKQQAVDLLEHVYPWRGKVVEVLDNGKYWNHSMLPNSGTHPDGEGKWNHSYALRDIETGEELTDDYTLYDEAGAPWLEELCKEYEACSCTECGRRVVVGTASCARSGPTNTTSTQNFGAG